jgi:hypothetical protein
MAGALPPGLQRCELHDETFSLLDRCSSCAPAGWTPEPSHALWITDCPIKIIEIDPLDGMTTDECLRRYQLRQRQSDVKGCRRIKEYRLSQNQLAVARSAWSSALRAKQAAARTKEREQVVCDEQWGEEL